MTPRQAAEYEQMTIPNLNTAGYGEFNPPDFATFIEFSLKSVQSAKSVD